MKVNEDSVEETMLSRLYDRLLFGMFISMLVVTPFVYQKNMDASVAFRRPKETAFQVLCILIIGTFLMRYIERGSFSALTRLKSLRGWVNLLKSTPFTAPVVMICIACLLSLMNVASSFYFWDTAVGVFGAAFVCFILSDVLKRNYKRLFASVSFISIAGSFMGGYCMLQYYSLDPLFVPRKEAYVGRTVSSGFIDNPNTVSGYLVAILPIVLSMFFVAKHKATKIAALIGSVLIFGGLLSACTRGALIAGVFALSVFLALVFLKSRYTKAEKRIIAIGSLIIIVFITFYVWINPFIYDRIANTKSVLNLRKNTRYIEWASGKRMMQDHFLVGVGLGNYKYYYLDYRGDAAHETEFIGRWEKANQAHNEFVQVGAELGFFGLFAMFWILGSFSWLIFRKVSSIKRHLPDLSQRDLQLEQRRANMLNGFLGSLLGLAGHCAFMFPLHIVPSAVVGVFVIGMSFALVRMPRDCLVLAGPPQQGRGRK